MRFIVTGMVLCVAMLAALAGAELTLKNGEVVVADDYRRVGNVYIVELADGEIVRIPADLVASMELTGAGESGGAPNVVGSRKEAPRAAAPAAPAAPREGSPAEPRFEAPRPPAVPRGAAPEAADQHGMRSDGPRDLTQRDENEVPWIEPPTDPTWKPEDGFEKSGFDNEWPPRRSQGNNQAWGKTWKPEDGFEKDGLDNEWPPKRTKTSFAAAGAAARAINAFLLEEGVASWYGERFQGKPTASGRPFDAAGFTAAHPSLPFGTLVLVTNPDNDRSIVLEVTDRGPSIGGRVINLSRAAAEELDMVERGLAPVSVRIVGS